MLRLARFFRDAGLVKNLHGGGGTEVGPIAQNPDDFFIGSNFDELRALSISAARADDGVAVREARGALRVDEAKFFG